MSGFSLEQLSSRLGSYIESSSEFRGESTYFVASDKIVEILRILKEEFKFTYLVDLTAVDYLGIKTPRFKIVYYLHRFGEDYDENVRVRINTKITEDNPSIDSATSLWTGADWLEREVFDMFGIVFKGHPDLRRILMPEDYDEFPLRKDFDVRNREPSKKSFQKALREGNF
jgi:NADH-quinone oxidoreductase subunit C